MKPSNLALVPLRYANIPASAARKALGALHTLWLAQVPFDLVVRNLDATSLVRLEAASRVLRLAVWQAGERTGVYECAWRALRAQFPFDDECSMEMRYGEGAPQLIGMERSVTAPPSSVVAQPGSVHELDVRWGRSAAMLVKRKEMPAWRFAFGHDMHGMAHAVRQVRGPMSDDDLGYWEPRDGRITPRFRLGCRAVVFSYMAHAIYDGGSTGFGDCVPVVDGGWSAGWCSGSSLTHQLYDELASSDHPIGSVAFCEQQCSPIKFDEAFVKLVGSVAARALSSLRGPDEDLSRGWRAIAAGGGHGRRR